MDAKGFTYVKNGDRRKKDRRKKAIPINFPDRRIHNRRASERRADREELEEQLWQKEILIREIKETLKRRAVITGIGVVAPNGIGKDAFWEGVKSGKNAVDRITFFDATHHPSQVAAEIRDFNVKDFMEANDASKMSRCNHLAIAAAREALKDSKLKIDNRDLNRVGVIVGTGGGGMDYAENELQKFYEGGFKKISPFSSTAFFCGSLSSNISIIFGLRGPSLTISTGCPAGTDAIGYAFNSIQNGTSDIILTGGSDACITPGIVAAFCRLNALSTKRNHEPKKACRPFNIDRDGFVMGEGAWILILEELSHALKRKAKIYAEIVGYGATCDAYHITRPLPSGEETANAIKIALKNANIRPEEVNYINAHGTSTLLNDKIETLAIKKVFGKHAYSLAVSSTKSMIGHPQGASGACGVAVCALAINDDFIPPTINYENPDPECDLDYVPNKGRESTVNVALCNSIGFGSKNSAIIVKKLCE